MHKVNSNFESDAKLTFVVRRLEALEITKGVQSLTLKPSKPVVSSVCVLCDIQDIWLNNAPGYQLSKPSKRMYSICFASLTQITTLSVKHIIRDGGTIPISLRNLLKEKDMVDHHHSKDHLLTIKFIRKTNTWQHTCPSLCPSQSKKTFFRGYVFTVYAEPSYN